MKKINQNYTIKGIVLPGMGRSNETGARTANLEVSLAKKMVRGLYSCKIKIQKKDRQGLLYFGYNSLSKKDCLEVHILNFSQDIYGQEITVITEKYIRPEKKFKNVAELKKQIALDLSAAKL